MSWVTRLNRSLTLADKPTTEASAQIGSDPARNHSVENKIAFVTLSNAGYVEYTLNCIASLHRLGKQGQNLADRLICYSIGDRCHQQLQVSGCQSVLIEDEDNADLQLFRQGKWAGVVAYKFNIISHWLQTHDVVCYCDGDIVYEDATVLDECFNRLDSSGLDMLIQNDSAKHRDRDHRNLCTGFMVIRSTTTTRQIFHPQTVEPYVNSGFCDQLHFNDVIKPQLQVGVLPLAQYPNGGYFYRYANKLQAKLIHFNYAVGHEKRARMKEFGKWYLD